MSKTPRPYTQILIKFWSLTFLFLAPPAFGSEQTPVPEVQSLLEVAPLTDETAFLLVKKVMSEGSLQSATEAQRLALARVFHSIQTPEQQKNLPVLLASSLELGGFNGSGGGGVIACFKNSKEAKSAVDSAGRLKRSYISKILELENFDTFRVIHRDSRRWSEAVNGDFHFRTPLPGEPAEVFLRRVLFQNVLAFLPLLVERLEAVLVRFPFVRWQGSAEGLPAYPDVDANLFADLKRPGNSCVYAQMVIRTVKNDTKPAERVHFVYDRPLLERMRELAGNESEFQRRLAVLILHEAAYFLVKENGAFNANEVYKVIELTLFDDADVDAARMAFFQPSGEEKWNQDLAFLFEEPYAILLAAQKPIEPWPSKLILFRAWLKTMRQEQALLQKQNCANASCMSGGGLLWFHLMTHPQEADRLTPVEAYFALTPSLTVNNHIPSPEALVSRSVDPRGTLTYSCRQIDFEKNSFSMHTLDGEVAKLPEEGGRIMFKKIKEFCQPALR